MAEPTAVGLPVTLSIGEMFGCTKILMPLLQPVRGLEIRDQLKIGIALARDDVAAGLRFARCRWKRPSARRLAMRQLLSGNSSDFGLRQPSVVLPSQSSFQPSAFSCSVSVLSSV